MKNEKDCNENIRRFKELIEKDKNLEFMKFLLDDDYKKILDSIEESSLNKTFEEYKNTIGTLESEGISIYTREKLYYFYKSMGGSKGMKSYTNSEEYINHLKRHFNGNPNIINSCVNSIAMTNIEFFNLSENTPMQLERERNFQILNLFCRIKGGYANEKLMIFFTSTVVPAVLNFDHIQNIKDITANYICVHNICSFFKTLLKPKIGSQQEYMRECIKESIDKHVRLHATEDNIETVKLFYEIITPGIIEKLAVNYFFNINSLTKKLHKIANDMESNNASLIKPQVESLFRDLSIFFSDHIPERCSLNKECLELIHRYLKINLSSDETTKIENKEYYDHRSVHRIPITPASYKLCKEFFNICSNPDQQEKELLDIMKNYDPDKIKLYNKYNDGLLPNSMYVAGLLANLKNNEIRIKITKIAIDEGINDKFFYEANKESHTKHCNYHDEEYKNQLIVMYNDLYNKVFCKYYEKNNPMNYALRSLLYICDFSDEEAIEKLYKCFDTNQQNRKNPDLGSYKNSINNIHWELASILIHKIKQSDNYSINLIRLLLKFNGYDKYGNCHAGRSYNMEYYNSSNYNNVDKGIDTLDGEELQIINSDKLKKLEQKEIKIAIILCLISGRNSSQYEKGIYHKTKEEIALKLIDLLDGNNQYFILYVTYIAMMSGIEGAPIALFEKLNPQMKNQNIEKIYETADTEKNFNSSSPREPICLELAKHIESEYGNHPFVIDNAYRRCIERMYK